MFLWRKKIKVSKRKKEYEFDKESPVNVKMAGALKPFNPVLLGYPDEGIGEEKIDYTISKIGGYPVSCMSQSHVV